MTWLFVGPVSVRKAWRSSPAASLLLSCCYPRRGQIHAAFRHGSQFLAGKFSLLRVSFADFRQCHFGFVVSMPSCLRLLRVQALMKSLCDIPLERKKLSHAKSIMRLLTMTGWVRQSWNNAPALFFPTRQFMSSRHAQVIGRDPSCLELFLQVR
jgi:hypothetical protein